MFMFWVKHNKSHLILKTVWLRKSHSQSPIYCTGGHSLLSLFAWLDGSDNDQSQCSLKQYILIRKTGDLIAQGSTVKELCSHIVTLQAEKGSYR